MAGQWSFDHAGKMPVRRESFWSQFAILEVTGRHDAADMAECLAWFPCFCLKHL